MQRLAQEDDDAVNMSTSYYRQRPPSPMSSGYPLAKPGRRAGHLARFPWTGVGALLGAVCGIAVCVGILVASDGNPIDRWKYLPTVYLSVAYTCTNLLVGLAFREGAIINWWRTASHDHTTLGDLHRRYEYGQSIWSAMLAGRKMNLIALAAILCTIVPINGPLLQRASTIGQAVSTRPGNISITAATSLDSATGFVTGRNYAVSFMTPDFQLVAQAFADGRPIVANGTGCKGSAQCYGQVKGLGLSVKCNTSSPSFNLEPPDAKNGTIVLPSASVFGTDLSWALLTDSNLISLSALFKNDTPCSGTVVQHNCTLTTAIVRYPIIIDGNSSTVQLDPNSTIWDDEIVNETVSSPAQHYSQGPVLLGGFWMALHDQLSSSMLLSFSGAVGYSISTDGAMSFPGRFANYSAAYSDGVLSSTSICGVTFNDPLPYMLSQARTLMFRKALADGNSSSVQNIGGIEVITENIFRSHYLFLGIALGLTLVAVLIVSVTFHGYWHVSQPITMNPLFLAKAFNSPLMRDVQLSVDVTEMAKKIGEMPVRLGTVFESTVPRTGARDPFEMSRTSMSKGASFSQHTNDDSRENLVTSAYDPTELSRFR